MITFIDAVKSLSSDKYISVSENGEVIWIDDNHPTDSEIQAELTRLQTEYDSNQYQRDRATEYPAIADQLDDIFHNGIDGWKATIQLTKDKYPKGGN
jgi:hypothetical protein